MITLKINNENTMDVSDFNRLCQALSLLHYDFDCKVTYDKPFVVTGDLSFLSEMAKRYYKQMIKDKCVSNIRLLKKDVNK